jgi:hypothetical protein
MIFYHPQEIKIGVFWSEINGRPHRDAIDLLWLSNPRAN